MRIQHFATSVLLSALLAGCADPPPTTSSSVDGPDENVPAAEAETPNAKKTTTQRGYTNSVNELHERILQITDDQGKPAVADPVDSKPGGKPIPHAKLEIVWTMPSQFSWNYSLPELHDGKDIFETAYPSAPLFLERKLKAKTVLEVAIPDTPYSFYILDGRVAPYFYDSDKAVIWQIKSDDLEKEFRQMGSISVSSKRMKLTMPGGDMAAFLVVDFSNRKRSPRVQYWIRYDGP